MTERIFEHLAHELGEAGHDIRSLFHHGRYHQPTPGATVPKGTTMNLTQLEADIRTEAQAAVAKAKEVVTHAETVVEQHLPQLADLAQKAATNPLIDAALSAVHVSPSFLASLAEMLMKADADLAALAPPPAPETPAEPSDPAAQPETPADGSQAADGAPGDGQNQTGIAV